MATANSARVACASLMRLERIMRRLPGSQGRSRQNDLLFWFWNVHVQTLLGDRLEAGAPRRVANRALEPRALGVEGLTLPLELQNPPLPVDAAHPPGNDARRDHDETDEHQGD